MQNGLNSIVILGAWMLRKHRNHCVFYGANPNLSGALLIAVEERRLWCMAGGFFLLLNSRVVCLTSRFSLVCGFGWVCNIHGS